MRTRHVVMAVLGPLAVVGLGAAKGPGAAADAEATRTTFVVLRHAEAVDDGTRDPGLSEAGRERAERVGRMLASMDVAAVLATNSERTGRTAGAIAERFGLEVERYEPGTGPKEDAAFVRSLGERFAGRVVVIVGHSNTVPGVVGALGVEAAPIGYEEYDRVYVVTPVEGAAPVRHVLRS